ncbi:MAG: guanylate kinase [Dehalococcoidia bacterium]|nr:MAG: guanylate kinase [Dehalococcoidia bacterium]
MKKTNPKNETPFNPTPKPLLIVLSGPSGAGKDAVLNRMKTVGHPAKFITTATTRTQRANEEDNVAYHFVSEKDFQKMLQNKELLEYANVYGNWYGVPREPVRKALEAGQDAIVKVDVQGAATLKKILPEAVFIFLASPTTEELETRLRERQTESELDCDLRLKTAAEEMKQLHLFDYIVFNERNEIERAASAIEAIITAEKCRRTPREISL